MIFQETDQLVEDFRLDKGNQELPLKNIKKLNGFCFGWSVLVLQGATYLPVDHFTKNVPLLFTFYLVQSFASFLTAVNELSFKQEPIIKIERFLDFIKSYNSSVSPSGPSHRPQTPDFPTLLYTSTCKIPNTRSLPVQAIITSTHPPRGYVYAIPEWKTI